jgi:Mg2+-importing ATPase
VLGVAIKEVPPQPEYSTAEESGMTFVGFLLFFDPPKPDAQKALADLMRLGVTLKVITGDNRQVAMHVARTTGMQISGILTGAELNQMRDEALWRRADQANLFVEVDPNQKERIILALRKTGHVVGYMGDGINDAPALHTADVGISVDSAVDVAKEAADFVLLEQSLDVLRQGIEQGRQTFTNTLKYVFTTTSANFGNMFSMAGASLFLPFLPMLPTQILLNNFLYDTAQITIPSDHVDAQYIRAPRRWNMALIRNFMIFIGPISSLYDFLTFYVLLHFFHAGQTEFHTGWFVESLATQTLVLFVIRTMRNPLKSRPSLPLAITTVLMVAIGILIPFSPFAARLGFTPLPGPFYTFLAVSTATYLIFVEFAKRRLFSRAHL